MLEESVCTLKETAQIATSTRWLRIVASTTTIIDLIGTRGKPPWELYLFSGSHFNRTRSYSLITNLYGLLIGPLSTAAPVPASGDNPCLKICVVTLDNSGRSFEQRDNAADLLRELLDLTTESTGHN